MNDTNKQKGASRMKTKLFILAAALLLSLGSYASGKELNDTKNWRTALLYNKAENAVIDGTACIKIPIRGRMISNIVYPVDPKKKYVLSGEYKVIGSPGAICYVCLRCFDENKVFIGFKNTNKVLFSDTFLAGDVDYSDKIIKVKDASKWKTGKNMCIAFDTPPPGTEKIIRNTSYGWGINKIEKKDSYWEVTLDHPCDMKYPAGTRIRLHTNRGYAYPIVSGELKATTEWQTFRKEISGETPYCIYSNLFRFGTRFVDIVVMANWTNIKNCTVVLRNIAFEEVAATAKKGGKNE